MIDDVTNKNTEYEFRIQKRIIAGGTGQTDLSRTGARTDHGFAPVSSATMTRAHSGRSGKRKSPTAIKRKTMRKKQPGSRPCDGLLLSDFGKGMDTKRSITKAEIGNYVRERLTIKSQALKRRMVVKR